MRSSQFSKARSPRTLTPPSCRRIDMALWFNRGLRHSAVDLHKSWAPRLVHQCQITGSDNPAFPEPIPRLPCTAKA